MNFDLSQKFQKVLLAALVREPPFAYTYRHVIKPEYFSGEAMVIICGALFSYMDKYGEHPSIAVLADKVRSDCIKWADDEIADTTIKLLKKLKKIKLASLDYISDRVRAFSEEAEWRTIMVDGPDLIDQGDFEELFDRAAQAREKSLTDDAYVFTDQLPERLERLAKVSEGGTIPTGVKHLDKRVKIYPPALCMVIGESSAGKTWFGIHLTKVALRRGYNVAFFTGEMTPDEVSTRLDASMLGINTSDFMISELHTKITDALARKYAALKGSLTIKNFQAQSYSVNMLEMDIRRMLTDPNEAPKVVVVDYLELLTYKDSEKRKLQGWEELVRISMSLKGIANKYRLVLWVIGMVSGEADESGLLTRKNKAMAKSTIYAPDYSFTLNRNQTDKERGMLRLYVDKGRHVKDQLIVAIAPDFEHSQFCAKSLSAKYRSDIKT